MNTLAPSRPPLASALFLATTALCVVLGASCDTPESAPSGIDDVAPAPMERSPEFMLDSDLATVCDGKAAPKGVAAYAKTAGKASPLLVFMREATTEAFKATSTTTFEPWRAEKAMETQLVACVTVKSATKARECKFDKEQPVRWVDQYDTTFEIAVREASTGKELAKQEVSLKAPSRCPTLFFFKNDREKDYAEFEPTLLGMMGELQPADAPKPKIRPADLVGACGDKAVLGATPYAKQPGAVSHLAVFHREGADGGWVEGAHPGQSFKKHDWWSSDAAKYQLVACITTTRGKKVKDCEFDGGSQVALVDASYTITLHEATTGNKLDEKRFEGRSQTRCPFIWNFVEGQENVFLADPGDAAQSWLASFAEPK